MASTIVKPHSFHIPVMGIGFTIDTPLKVSHYGIDSVISLVDDILLEKLRKMYCRMHELPYQEITDKIEDFRAKRITSYLNLINKLTQKKFETLKNITAEKRTELQKYLSFLPDNSTIKQEFKKITAGYLDIGNVKKLILDNLTMGRIDVNIMTKVDKDNYVNGEKLPVEFNDAHAALRGFANSDLESSIILSAGMSPRLYGYIENFSDFYPTATGYVKKKIVLKVSDYRSALIQGKFLAKKGLWVSEYRIESGLNCGGHAFATQGHLLGPVLEEFAVNREELIDSVHGVFVKALEDRTRIVPDIMLPVKITAQGGVGTAEEHQFLIDHYNLDSVGWGTPFLLVPEATTVDDKTRHQLTQAQESDLYLSDISPLGVPFNSLKCNTKDQEKLLHERKGRAGSACPKKYLALNKEFSEEGICTASRQYQHLKLKELDNTNLSFEEYESRYDKIVNKSCICVGLGTPALLANNLDTKVEGEGVSVCPGPNMAYFSKILSLKEMIDHVYGRSNIITRDDRPHMFLKELNIYIDYLKGKIEDSKFSMTRKQQKYLMAFSTNLQEGVEYYHRLFGQVKSAFADTRGTILDQLDNSSRVLHRLKDDLSRIEMGTTAKQLAGT